MKRPLRLTVPGISVLLFLLFFTGCVRHPEVVAVTPPVPDVATLLARLSDLDGRYDSLSALARAHIVRDGENRTVQQALLVRKPDRLRVDLLGPFSYPLLQIAAARQLQVYIPGEGRFYSGEASVANFARFTGLPLRIEQLVGIILLQLPRFHYVDAVSLWRDGEIVLALDDGGRMHQEFAFAPGGELLRAAYWREGELLCDIRYGNYAAEPPFPRRIALQLPSAKLEATLDLTEIDTTRSLDDALFLLKVPEKTPILPFPDTER